MKVFYLPHYFLLFCFCLSWDFLSLSASTIREICNLEEDVGGARVKAMRQSIVNAALHVSYDITRTQYDAIKGTPRFQREVDTDTDRLLKGALHQGLTGEYWEFVDVFSTAMNSKLIRHGRYKRKRDGGDTEDTNPFHAPVDTRQTHFGVMAYRGDTVLIAFKGSREGPSWVCDFSQSSIDLKEFHPTETGLDCIRRFFDSAALPSDDPIRVHRGFLRAALSSQEEIFASLRAYQEGHRQDRLNVVVTGHSLGGAMATVFCAALKPFLEDAIPDHNLNLITFGAPRAFCHTDEEKVGELYRRKISDDHMLRVVTSYHGWTGLYHDHVGGVPLIDWERNYLLGVVPFGYKYYAYYAHVTSSYPIPETTGHPKTMHTTAYETFITHVIR